MKFIDVSGVAFECDVSFGGNVTFSVTPPEISLDNLTDLSMTGDLTVGDAADITGAVTMGSTLAVTGNITGSAAVQGADLIATDDLTVGDDATITGDLTVSNGNVVLTAGSQTITAGDLTLTAGDIIVTAGDLTVTSGDVDFSGANSVTPPTGFVFAKQYVSQTITEADLTAGASCTVALTGEPTGMIIAAWMETIEETTSSSGDTTGLTMKVGTAGVDDGILADTSIFGALSIKSAATGSLVNGAYGTLALIATFTATGGSPDCADINALSVKVGLMYMVPV